jgi:hypothetical protein
MRLSQFIGRKLHLTKSRSKKPVSLERMGPSGNTRRLDQKDVGGGQPGTGALGGRALMTV